MKAAFAVWNERIAPVFDVARHVRLVDADGGRVLRTETGAVPAASAAEKARWLVDRGVGLLVCGAISRPLYGTIAAHGIEVIPFVAGDLGEITNAWLAGTLEEGPFSMPGCCGRGRRFGGRGFFEREGSAMNGKNRGAGGGGGGGNRRGGGGGGAGGGAGRMGGRAAGGPGGVCVCSACGHREPHERGVPCSGKQCPKCGAAMTRE